MDDFVTDAENKVKNLILELGWNYENFSQIQENARFVVCPNNAAHRLPAEKLQDHLERCDWLSEGYSADDPPLSISQPSVSSVTMTPALQDEIIQEAAAQDANFKTGSRTGRPVPKTASRLQKDFTRDERLALYDYVMAKTETAVEIPEFIAPQPAEEKRELSELELAAAERDAKRRRASYRNKVHTNRKTHVEIMREVIESQMNCLLDDPTKRPIKEEPTEPQQSYLEDRRDSSRQRREPRERDRSRGRREERRQETLGRSGHERDRSSREERTHEPRHARSSSRYEEHDRSRKRNEEHRKQRSRERRYKEEEKRRKPEQPEGTTNFSGSHELCLEEATASEQVQERDFSSFMNQSNPEGEKTRKRKKEDDRSRRKKRKKERKHKKKKKSKKSSSSSSSSD